MSVDDPIRAADEIIAAEERQRSAAHWHAAHIAAWLPGTLGKALSKLLDSDEHQKLAYFVEVLKAEVGRIRDQVERLIVESEQHRKFAEQEWPALALDGLRRAQQTRARVRIARIAAILTNSLVEQPVATAEDVEEMMRIAMELADRDILALKLIADSASGSSWSDRLSWQHAWDLFERVPWRSKGFYDSDVESVCSKLASFGLLARLDIPPNQNMTTTMHNGYELLQKGRAFLRFVRSQAESAKA